ncbi:hypothetical protein FPZ42_02835 [Mucilaginibacter achroorhodeus]|uniref:Uncharacterized protein n=1 Tax=Mucilaginibacter achroorhodeus TaxID=2599294 RepID=A0A563U9Y9_9SPHI|nr:hypothetical protein [Mucilaginibacter achroorhodeus]TWR28165.1 hypothetical protein FPZ42_02835 [Mucilaginibacter achroorhodeus]
MKLIKKVPYTGTTFKKYIICTLFFLLAVVLDVNAQQGCLFNGAVYTTYNRYIFIFVDLSYYSNPISASCPVPSTPANTYLYTFNPSGSCSAGSGPSFFPNVGTLVSYQMRQCPLDDFLPLLFSGIAFIGIWKMRYRYPMYQKSKSSI